MRLHANSYWASVGLKSNINSIETECVLKINFKQDASWFFESGSVEPLQSGSSAFYNDFQLMAARLITQGLGFYSNLIGATNEDGSVMALLPRAYSYNAGSKRKGDYGQMTFLDSIVYGRRPESLMNILVKDFDRYAPMQPLSLTWKKFDDLGLYRLNSGNIVSRTMRAVYLKLTLWLRKPFSIQFGWGE